jgi:hypothetical protein
MYINSESQSITSSLMGRAKLKELSTTRSGEKFEPISTNPYLSIINRLFNEINRLFLKFLLEIEIFIENWSDISLKFFISTGYLQISTGYLITKPRFSPDISLPAYNPHTNGFKK